MDILERLSTATTNAEREAIVLEMSLAALTPDLQAAIQAAAIPHWFSSLFLDALLAQESDDLYDDLLDLNFVEYVAGKGYAIHERPRQHLLNKLWQNKPDHFRELSRRAADYCGINVKETDDPEWQAEAIYHQLVSDPDAGVARLRDLGTKWANYEYHTYEEIERTVPTNKLKQAG